MQPDEDRERDEPALSAATMARLDRERTPRPDVEDMVVTGLRQRGWFGRSGRRRHRALTLVAASIAAGLAFAIGLRVGARRATPTANVARTNDSARVAPVDPRGIAIALRSLPTPIRVRVAGAAYIEALAAVNPDSLAARTAALATLRTASDQILRIAPGSDMSLAIRMAFAASFAASPAVLATSSREPSHLIQF